MTKWRTGIYLSKRHLQDCIGNRHVKRREFYLELLRFVMFMSYFEFQLDENLLNEASGVPTPGPSTAKRRKTSGNNQID